MIPNFVICIYLLFSAEDGVLSRSTAPLGSRNSYYDETETKVINIDLPWYE